MNRRKNQYTSLRNEERYEDLQFQDDERERIPWKGIYLAIFLTIIGSVFLLLSVFPEMFNNHYEEFPLPLFILGLIAFIPGSYHVWLAYNAFQGTPGYSLDDIPNFD